MSFAYDQYLAEHIGNVNKGLNWMLDNLGFKEERPELEIALVNFDHDDSKYSIEEYDAYDKYFYGGNRSYKVVQDFNYAWLHHIHNNPHHWQYWVLLEDDPESGLPYKALEIPVHVIFEMIADWWSFSWKSGNLFEIFSWYADHRSKQIINPKSREIVEYILERIWKVLIMQETVAGHDISEIEKQYRRFWAEKDVDLLNWDHPSPQVIGKVIDIHETENGLVATVEHSGIKGQRWGIRNGPPYPLGENAHRKMKLAELPKYGSIVFKDRETFNKMTEDGMPCSTNPNSFIKEKGTTVYRVSKYKYDQKHIRGRTYISDNPDDYLGIDTIGGTNYVNAYKLKKDLVISGKKDIEETFTKLSGKNIYDKGCRDFMNLDSLGIRDAFIKEMTEKGYDGMLDPFDTMMSPTCQDDGYPISYTATIIFDSDNLRFVNSKKADKYVKHSDISEDDEDLYGVPELKKFPMPDKKHVKSAIRFFNYVDPKYEKELAEAIIEKAEEFGLDLESDISVGDENRFGKYLKREES